MELEKIYILWSMANTALLSIVGIYTWIANRDKASRKAIHDVSTVVQHVDKRVVKLETAIQQVPTDRDLDVLHKRITELSEMQKGMGGELHHMNRTLNLIHEYLLNHRGGR